MCYKNTFTISSIDDIKSLLKRLGTSSYMEFNKKIKGSIFIFKNNLLYVNKETNEYNSHFNEPYLSLTLADENVKKIMQSTILSFPVNYGNISAFRNIIFNGKENIYIEKNTYFGACIFNDIVIHSSKKEAKLNIEGGKANNIAINNTNFCEGVNILLDNFNITNLSLENINNNFESFEIRNCVIDKLVIKNSNLGKAVFNGVTIKELEIQNATLNDCIFNGVNFDNNYDN